MQNLTPADGTDARSGVEPLEHQPITFAPNVARPWPRYWARMIDIMLEGIACVFIVVIPTAILATATLENGAILDFSGPTGRLKDLLLLPIVMFADAVIYTLLGNSPGKAILGIRVRHLDGTRLSFADYLSRNFSMYLKGLGIGFPPISLFTLILSHARASRAEAMSWDIATNSRPYSEAGGARTMLGAACLLITAAGLFALAMRHNAL